MHYVYILQSLIDTDKFYTGQTTDLKKRLKEHNDGKSTYANKHKPWKVYCYFAMENSIKAKRFEEYLKTASGRRFLKRFC